MILATLVSAHSRSGRRLNRTRRFPPDGYLVSAESAFEPSSKENEPDDACRRAGDAWIDQQMRVASRPPIRLMRGTIITGVGAGLATSLCGVLILGLGGLLNFTIFGVG
jgi:hypothetical protein